MGNVEHGTVHNTPYGRNPPIVQRYKWIWTKGCNYIAEVDIPDTVQNAFVELKDIYSENIRTANPKYASPKI